MKVAIASQDETTITAHAGHCQRFWIYDTRDTDVLGRDLLELPKEQSFHNSSPKDPHPLDAVQVLIARGMGKGLIRRLEQKGVKGLITEESNPDVAIQAYLHHTLVEVDPDTQTHHHDHAHDDEAHTCQCGQET